VTDRRSDGQTVRRSVRQNLS